jgi:hypothetical protein
MGNAAVGIGSGTTVMALTTLPTGWHGFDSAHAGAAALLLCSAGSAVYLFAAWLIGWKWPSTSPGAT